MKILADKLITHPTAVLAKDRGFDFQCENYFYGDGSKSDPLGRVYSESDLFYEQPTQSLLAKWLREVHNIDILVEKYIGGSSGVDEVYSCCVYRITGTVGDFRKELIYAYDTYEEALEAGLCTGLNLINNK